MTSTATARPDLVLASASPRRRELLGGLGLRFTVRPADIDETVLGSESGEAYVVRLALEKAAWRVAPGELVLAADTVVQLDGALLGKPRDADDAREMLARIRGRSHTVLTGLALHDGTRGRRERALEVSTVRMAAMDDAEIDWYVETGEPLDKAGSYAIQGCGALFVEEVRGNYTNVVGLPLPTTYRLFSDIGYDLRQWIDA